MEKETNVKGNKILLIIALIIIVVMGGAIYKIVNDNKEKVENNNSQIEESKKENDILVLYNGLDIKKDDIELSIKDTDENRNTYGITWYNYEDGKYVGETKGDFEESYENYLVVSGVSKIAISKKYNAIPREYTVIKELPKKLEELADYNQVNIHAIDLDGDEKLEYVVACASSASPEDYDIAKYTNYSEIMVFDNEFNKIATLVSAKDQYWEINGEVKDEFFCSLDDVEYIDIDEDGKMEILVDTNVYEGMGVNVYKFENNKITGNVDYEVVALP